MTTEARVRDYCNYRHEGCRSSDTALVNLESGENLTITRDWKSHSLTEHLLGIKSCARYWGSQYLFLFEQMRMRSLPHSRSLTRKKREPNQRARVPLLLACFPHLGCKRKDLVPNHI